jgi:branched-chain amino acid transport system ATP-binding protein
MLDVKNLVVRFDKVEVLKGVSFHVAEGEIVALVGANGAGKTTTLRTISGLENATDGEILFNGTSITNVGAPVVTSAGIAHVPEGRRVFAQMSVRDNLYMGAYNRTNSSDVERDIKDVYVRFPRLQERGKQMAGTLSGGEQQMLAIGRALMSSPAILLLDEPSLGLAPLMCNQIVRVLKDLHRDGKTIVLVEQNARMALNVADRGYVIERGEVALTGSGNDLLNDPQVKKAYLGVA